MTTKHLNTFIKPSVVALFIFLVGSSVAHAAIWTGPTSAPPNPNKEAPINESGKTQTKSGVLNVGGIRSYVDAVIDGNVDIGTAASHPNLHMLGGNVRIHLQGSGATFLDLDSGAPTQARAVRFGHSGGALPFSIGQNTNTGASSLGFFNSNVVDGINPSMVLTSLGNIGIGNLNPGYKLDVTGSVGSQAFYYTSDKTLKKNITPLSGSLSNISKLQGVSFNWKEGGEKSVGLVAQDVEKVYPELVHTNPENGIKSVQYGNLVAPLIEAIKEQQKQIDELRAEVEMLKAAK